MRTSGGAPELLEALLRAAPPELVVTPVDVRHDALTVRVALDSSALEAPPAGLGKRTAVQPLRN